MPVGSAEDFKGIVDLIAMKFYTFEGENGEDQIEHDIPAEHLEEAKKKRDRMIETVAGESDGLMEKYLENGTLNNAEIIEGLKHGCMHFKLQPMLLGSALKNKGVQMLLDAVVAYLPNPIESHNMTQYEMDDLTKSNPVETKPDPKAPLRAMVFKIMNMPQLGDVSFVRVYQGQINEGDQLLCMPSGKPERASRMVKLVGAAPYKISDSPAGDICALVGLKNTLTGDTLVSPSDTKPMLLEGITFAKPVITMAIEPKSNADKEKLAYALARLEREDPTFKKWTDPETSQLIIAGMGELHLEVLSHRIRDEYKVDAIVGKPKVSYRETITKSIEIRGKHVKQSGGRGQYGDCTLEIRPLTAEEIAAGHEIIFEDGIRGGTIPKEYRGPIEEGVRSSLQRGYISGFPTINVHIKLIDGSYHDVDSSQEAFIAAGSLAIREAFPKLGCVVLEPWMKVEVETPDQFTGTVMGSLQSKRAMITETLDRGVNKIICCEVPLEGMFGYTTDLRSMSQGRASYSMEPANYKQVPAALVAAISKKA